ncbi:hypothetical protein ACF9IK_13520 [Kitasatospora hibisci]|uniref:Pepco domain-containing protein n=1 Tax=Kitasatospora hibisci TaxID=3369522 RepID=UPI003753FAF7
MSEQNEKPAPGTVKIMIPVWEEVESQEIASDQFGGSEDETFQQEGKRLDKVKRVVLRKGTELADVHLDEKSYNDICSQVFNLVAAQEKTQPEARKDGGFRVDEITVRLGVHAQGAIAFIAEAGVEASIEVTFKRSH